MPAFIGPLQISNVAGGTVQFGDTLNMSPKTNGKTNAGSGAVNTAAFIVIANGVSATNHIDNNLIDQPTVGNN